MNIYRKEWKIGCIKADAQNVARRLMDMPSNKMTPLIFANVSCLKNNNNNKMELSEIMKNSQILFEY